ncbi:Uncharacterised protein [Mycobacteroides abscessus]|nr:Uncharacterised protein [Mycobacteroides abscessus]
MRRSGRPAAVVPRAPVAVVVPGPPAVPVVAPPPAGSLSFITVSFGRSVGANGTAWTPRLKILTERTLR